MIQNVSRRTLAILAGVGFTLAAIGWMDAWKQRHMVAEIQERGTGPAATKSRQRTPRAERTAMDLSDPQSTRLLRMIEELERGSRSGEPNPQFAKVAQTALEDANFQRRLLNFRLLMDHLRPEDALTMHGLFVDAERAGRPFAEEYATFSNRWGQIDGEGAMSYWAAREPFDMKGNDLGGVMNGWANTDPEAALAWIAGHKDLMQGMNPYAPALAGWFNKDQAAATQWLSQQSDADPGQVNVCVRDLMINMLYSDGIQSASKWLADLPETGNLASAALNGWNDNQYRLQNLDPQQAAAAWGAVGNEKWMGIGEFARFCGTVARANGDKLDGFMDSLSKSWPEAEAAAQFERWADQNPENVGNMLMHLPPSAVRTAGIQGMLKSLQERNPSAAGTWQARFGN
jgi:hypothetical protein